jgi:lipopolysaccharide biosynthesis glycosyltransferase
MIENTIICVKWGTKYNNYVEKLKKQIEKNCSVPFNFYCLTDTPINDYDITLPNFWDKHYRPTKFWAYRKLYIFNEDLFPTIQGNKFLYLDLDILIHKDLKYFFNLDMKKPYIVKGWWNNVGTCKKNYGKIMSTPLNSSIVRWDRGQLKPIYEHVNKNSEVIFFTYRTIDNYYNHFFYDMWNENESFFNVYPKGDIYSWYKGNIFPNDMELKKLRIDHKICLFNNSADITNNEHMHQIKEIKELW